MRLCFIALLILGRLTTQAQFKDDNLNEDFIFYVKSIDDFFDRFNNAPNTGFNNYLRTSYPSKVITRRKMISALFNSGNPTLANQKKEINELIVEVTDSMAPEYLNYSDQKWFAQLNCRIRYNNKPKLLTLILKVENHNNKQFWWSLVSAEGDFLNNSTIADTTFESWRKINPQKSVKDRTKYFLTPVSHGIDFINIDEIFINKSHIDDYVYNGVQSNELQKLIFCVKSNRIKFEYIETVTYHFLELDNWILVVDYYNRKGRNSGWLINSLLKVTNKQKEQYQIKYLNIPVANKN